MMRDWTEEEVRAMHHSYMEEGATLRELGRQQGVTYERIRQLFIQHDLPTKKFKRQTLKRYEQEFEAWQRRDEIIEAYKRYGVVEDVAKEVELPRQYVAPVVASFELRHLYRKKGDFHTYDQDAIAAALKRAAEICGEPLTIPDYRKIAPRYSFPADLTIIRAFDTWEAACAYAGVLANPAEGPRKNAITPQQCIDALRECSRALQRVPSYEAYSQWAKASGKPSGPTIRVKIGPWRDALLIAFDG